MTEASGDQVEEKQARLAEQSEEVEADVAACRYSRERKACRWGCSPPPARL